MTNLLAGALGFLGALIAHDIAAQALEDLALRPLAGTCPRCGHRRGWLTVACGRCGRRIGREMFWVVVSMVSAVGFANTLGPVWALTAYLGFLVLSLALGITDLASLRIVDRLNLPGTLMVVGALGLASLADGAGESFVRALLGGAAYFAGTNLVYFMASGRGFGYGDVKLSVQLGVFTAYISWGTLGWGVFLTTLIGGILSIGVLLSGLLSASRSKADGGVAESSIRQAMRAELPYGPAMILGAWLSIALAGLGAFPIPT